MAVKAKTAIEEKLDLIGGKIHEILDAPEPADNILYEAYLKHQINGVKFLDELDEVKLVFEFAEQVELVPLEQFNQMLKTADSSNVEFDGEFCKLAIIQTFKSPDKWILYVSPVESI